jgi:GntR family transcriptional regulator
MTQSQALAIQIVTGDARPIFRQIVDGIRKEIAAGNLAPQSKLPSVRALAIQLTINANTVAKAYTELTNQGLVESRKGLGLFVSQPKQLLSEQEQQKRLNTAIAQLSNEVMYLDYSAEHICEQLLNELKKFGK